MSLQYESLSSFLRYCGWKHCSEILEYSTWYVVRSTQLEVTLRRQIYEDYI